MDLALKIHMARRTFEIDSTTPYHVSSRCINREWFGLPLEQVWQITTDQLFFVKHAYDLKIFSFVLMQNHFHLIVQAPEGNLSTAMAYFLRETSKELTKSSGRINRTWGGRFFRSRLGNYHYLMQTYKYVYQNPIRAGICNFAEQYPYSTLSGLLGFQKLTVPLEPDFILSSEQKLEDILKWLNQLPAKEDLEAVRRALLKKDFTLPRCLKKKSLNPLELRLL